MVVLLTNENRGFGGAEVHTLDLAVGLSAMGLEVHLATPGDGWLCGAARERGVSTHDISMKSEIDPVAIARLVGLLGRLKVEVLHCQATRDLTLAHAARRLAVGNIPLVKSEHSYLGDSRSYLLNNAFRSAEALVCVSEALRRQMSEALQLEPERFTVIANGLDLERYHPARVKPHPALAEGRWLGVLSGLRKAKGQLDFLRAARSWKETFPDLKLVLAGEGPDRELFEEEARQLGLEVLFLGQVDDPASVLAALEVVVVPSHEETFSLVCLEAMALARPLVASRCGGIPEVTGEQALLYPTGDVEALCQGVTELLLDSAKARQLAASGRRRAEQHFSRAAMLGRYRDLYEGLTA